MLLCFTNKHHVGGGILSYQEAMNEEFQEEVKTNSESPWNDSLFKIDDDSSQLSEDKLGMFHVLAMKGALLVKRARLNLEPGLVFLASRFRASTQKDWSKLV